MVTCLSFGNRFKFIEAGLPDGWRVTPGNNGVPQTMMWELEKAQVFWEMHDGVIDQIPRESTGRLRLCLKQRDPKRQFVYVKPNFSVSRSRPFVELARQEQVLLLTCPRWSIYSDVMFSGRLYADRERLREIRSQKDPRGILFMGGNTKYKFDRSIYDQRPYSYGIAGADARELGLPGAPDPVMIAVDRQIFIDQARARWSGRFHAFEGLNPADYIRHLSGEREPAAAFCFQPHGVGLRHAIYEGMAMGVPSIIPESSYLDDITRQCNIVYSGNVLPDVPDRRPDLERACIEAYEAHMTPKAIVNNVLGQLREWDLY